MRVVRFYEADAWGDRVHPGGVVLTERLAQLAGVKQSSIVLDVASGKGASALFLARNFRCTVLGIDFSREMVEQAKRSTAAGGESNRVAFLIGEAEMLPLSTCSFDTVLIECSFSLIKDKGRAANEFWRVLYKGGCICIADFYLGTNSLFADVQSGFFPCPNGAGTEKDYRALLSNSGFRDVYFEDQTDKLREFFVELIFNFCSIGNFQDGFPPDFYQDGCHAGAHASLKKAFRDGALRYCIIHATK